MPIHVILYLSFAINNIIQHFDYFISNPNIVNAKAKETIQIMMVNWYNSALSLIQFGITFKDGFNTKKEKANKMNTTIKPFIPMLSPV